jgi:phosphohistidine phosphatase SixA
MNRLRGTLLLALACSLATGGPAAAQDGGQQLTPRLQGMALMQALRQGGYTILLRHAATEQFTPDPNLFDIDDCATQRNLSEEGRRQAERIGQSFAKLGIPVGEVLSSPYCRCVDTATLAFGKVTKSDTLSVGEGLSYTEKTERAAAVRKMLNTPPRESGANTVLIAHTGTLLYSFGLDSSPEGIAHVFKPIPIAVGQAVYIGSLTPDAWPRLAGLEAPAPE